MSLHRFFCPIELSLNKTVVLPDAVARHAGRSLRLRHGDDIILFNGQGGQYTGQILFSEGQTLAKLIEFNDNNFLPKPHINIIQALPQGDKLDWIIEKNSELGVTEITPIQSARSIVNLEGKRLEKRQERWNKISVSAAEQCGRNVPLQVNPLCNLKQAIERYSDHHLLLCQPDAQMHLQQFLRAGLEEQKFTSNDKFALLIGPEGGWSDAEIKLLSNSAHTLRWGELILRTETAALVLSTTLINTLGEP